MYRYAAGRRRSRGQCGLLGSGAILREVIAAAELLAPNGAYRQRGVQRHQLQRTGARGGDGRALEPASSAQAPRPVTSNSSCAARAGRSLRPIMSAPIRNSCPLCRGRFVALGTDGFGRSDTRAALRRFFEVDRHSIVLAALHTLVRDGHLERTILQAAIEQFGIDVERPAPWTH